MTTSNDAGEVEICDYCGDPVDLGPVATLVCGHKTCARRTYHQPCIEDHLRKCKLTPERLSGFPCPVGCGKKSTSEPCKGTIDSSHRKIIKAEKKKKAAVVMPPPTRAPPAPKPKPAPAPAPQAAPAASSRPVPVRGAVPPGPRPAPSGAGGDKTKEQMERDRALIASLRKEIGGGGAAVRAGAATSAAKAATSGAAANGEATIGKGAASRLGKGAQVQQQYIPGMEPADPRPAPARAAKQSFNLLEEKSSFPSLGAAQKAPPPAIPGDKPPAAAAPQQQGSGASAINAALDHKHQGWLSGDDGLARYNAMLGITSGPEVEEAEGAGGGSGVAAAADVVGEGWAAAEVVAAPDGGYGTLADISDELLMRAYTSGLEVGWVQACQECGLEAKYAPVLEQLHRDMGNPEVWAEAPAVTPEQQVEADRVEYEKALQVVLDSERSAAAYVEQQQQQQQHVQAGQYAQQAPLDLWAAQPNPHLSAPPLAPAALPVPMPMPAPIFVQPVVAADKLAELHAPKQAGVGEEVDEELFEDLLSLCLG